MTNAKHSVLYTGVTSNLLAPSAIAREKQIKGGSRQDKINMIDKMNPRWCDLYEQLQ